MGKNNDCKLVQDLLPSYIDKITSQETNEFIEKHLSECEKCNKILKDMGEEVVVEKIDEKKQINYLKKIKRRHRIVISIILIISIIVSITLISFFSSDINLYKATPDEPIFKTFLAWLTHSNPENYLRTNMSHIIVQYPELKKSMLFTFDTEKGICIGCRWHIEDLIQSDQEEFKQLTEIPPYAITDINLDNDKVSYNINIWNGQTIQEVKDMIYEMYKDAEIIEY